MAWLASRGPVVGVPDGLRWTAVVVLVAVGLAFDGPALWAFWRSRTSVNPLRPERATALVTGGVYRFTRNPMYLGMLAHLLAWAAYLASPWALPGPVAFVAYITRFQIVPEERALAARFGDEYRRYTARVRRWL